MRPSALLFVLACALSCANVCLDSQEAKPVVQATVPMSVEGNVPIVTLGFRRPDGGLRTARFVFDSGGGAVILDQRLATELALKPEGATITSDGNEYRRITLPPAFVGSMPVDLQTSNAFVHLGSASFDQRDKVEGLLPARRLSAIRLWWTTGVACSLSENLKALRTEGRPSPVCSSRRAATPELSSKSQAPLTDFCSIPEHQ